MAEEHSEKRRTKQKNSGNADPTILASQIQKFEKDRALFIARRKEAERHYRKKAKTNSTSEKRVNFLKHMGPGFFIYTPWQKTQTYRRFKPLYETELSIHHILGKFFNGKGGHDLLSARYAGALCFFGLHADSNKESKLIIKDIQEYFNNSLQLSEFSDDFDSISESEESGDNRTEYRAKTKPNNHQ